MWISKPKLVVVKKLRELVMIYLAFLAIDCNAQIPVTDAGHIAQRIIEWTAKDIPYSAVFNKDTIEALQGLREYAPDEYAELMAFLESNEADEFEQLVGLVNSANKVFSYNEDTNLIYHNSLKELIKTAVMAEKSYNVASASQNKYEMLAKEFVETLSAADREAAVINATSETASSIQTLVKVLAQQIRTEAASLSEKYHHREVGVKAAVDKKGRNGIGCKKVDGRQQYFDCSIRELEAMNEQNISTQVPVIESGSIIRTVTGQ